MTPSQFEASFTSAAHAEVDVAATLVAAEKVFAQVWVASPGVTPCVKID